MSWLSEKIFGKRVSYWDDLAAKLYDALVLDGGPSGASESHIDANSLGIRLNDLERFAEKRLITLEALLFVASNIETAPNEEEAEKANLFGPLHPLPVAMGKLLEKKWSDRGIVLDGYGVGERCFAEVELVIDKPFKWCREWLNEFYDNPESAGEHYIMYTEQWLKEFKTLRMMVDSYK